MTAPAAAGLLAFAVFGAGMLHAVITDLRHRRIRNWLVAALATCWAPMALLAGIPAAEMAATAAAALAIFVAGVGCFSAGWLGGGDVKLAAVVVLWLGAGQAAAFLLLAAVLGGVMAGLLLLTRAGAPFDLPPSGVPRGAAPLSMPYGPALAVAGLALLHGSPWAAVL